MSEYYVHPSAVVDPGAQIGSQTKIWHFCHVMSTAILGKQCILGQNVFVGSEVVIGNGVKIQNNVSVYAGVILDDDVFVGPSVVFTNVINPRSFIERKSMFLETVVGKGATIGANATVLCGVRIGRFAMIGAGSVVTKDIPDFAQITGNPGHITGWRSEQGGRLVFKSYRAICPITGEVYNQVGLAVQKLTS